MHRPAQSVQPSRLFQLRLETTGTAAFVRTPATVKKALYFQ